MKFKVLEGSRTLIICFEDEIANIHDETGCTVIGISDLDWNRDLSPWPAPRVFKKGEDFTGMADETIETMMKEIRFSDYDQVILAGYSLAGLFVLYACTKTDAFTACVSASGSLWYPGFTDYLRDNPLRCQKVYLSLGDREKNSRNPLMAQVQEKTEETYEIIRSYLPCQMHMNAGGHFDDPQGRLLKGMHALLG